MNSVNVGLVVVPTDSHFVCAKEGGTQGSVAGVAQSGEKCVVTVQ